MPTGPETDTELEMPAMPRRLVDRMFHTKRMESIGLAVYRRRKSRMVQAVDTGLKSREGLEMDSERRMSMGPQKNTLRTGPARR